MNHNLKLNDGAAATVSAALADIDSACQRASEFARLSPTVRAYLGAIRDAGWRIGQIVFETDPDDSEYGLTRRAHCPVCDQDTTLPLGCLQCEPEAAELEAILDAEDAIVARKAAAITADEMVALLDEGVIDMREFQLELEHRGIVQTHPCIQPGCSHTVLFDGEPYCYTHSPDEGSGVRGYSYLMNARRARQTADSCGENFIM